jgi:anti-anti-sigma factor
MPAPLQPSLNAVGASARNTAARAAERAQVRLRAVPFTLHHDPIPGGHLIEAGGELDYAATPQLSAVFTIATAAGERVIVLDLTQVEFIDSTALGTILRFREQLESQGGQLEVVCLDGAVKRLLEITNLARSFRVHGTRETALDAASAHAQP